MPPASHNPFGLCTWDDAADCDGCGLRDKLHCRWDAAVLGRFLIPASAFSLIAILGVGLASYVTGEWGILAAYLAFFVVFFLVVEIRVLCSHCPYYAREGSFLRCLANYGAPRLWRYRPGPLSAAERIALLIGFAVFGGYPLVAQVYGICRLTGSGTGASATLPAAIIITVATLVALVVFAAVLTLYFCPRCINFSCPLNRVPSAVREEYRAKNPVLLREQPGGEVIRPEN
jgi:hypothetical protein